MMEHKNILLFYLKGSKKFIHSKILHILKAYFTIKIVKQDKCQKYNGSCKLMC
jgi:hypothetical protein